MVLQVLILGAAEKGIVEGGVESQVQDAAGPAGPAGPRRGGESVDGGGGTEAAELGGGVKELEGGAEETSMGGVEGR